MTEPRDLCPNCGRPVAVSAEVPAHPGRDAEARQRGACYSCGLQVVRRPDEAWHGIRG